MAIITRQTPSFLRHGPAESGLPRQLNEVKHVIGPDTPMHAGVYETLPQAPRFKAREGLQHALFARMSDGDGAVKPLSTQQPVTSREISVEVNPTRGDTINQPLLAALTEVKRVLAALQEKSEFKQPIQVVLRDSLHPRLDASITDRGAIISISVGLLQTFKTEDALQFVLSLAIEEMRLVDRDADIKAAVRLAQAVGANLLNIQDWVVSLGSLTPIQPIDRDTSNYQQRPSIEILVEDKPYSIDNFKTYLETICDEAQRRGVTQEATPAIPSYLACMIDPTWKKTYIDYLISTQVTPKLHPQHVSEAVYRAIKEEDPNKYNLRIFGGIERIFKEKWKEILDLLPPDFDLGQKTRWQLELYAALRNDMVACRERILGPNYRFRSGETVRLMRAYESSSRSFQDIPNLIIALNYRDRILSKPDATPEEKETAARFIEVAKQLFEPGPALDAFVLEGYKKHLADRKQYGNAVQVFELDSDQGSSTGWYEYYGLQVYHIHHLLKSLDYMLPEANLRLVPPSLVAEHPEAYVAITERISSVSKLTTEQRLKVCEAGLQWLEKEDCLAMNALPLFEASLRLAYNWGQTPPSILTEELRARFEAAYKRYTSNQMRNSPPSSDTSEMTRTYVEAGPFRAYGTDNRMGSKAISLLNDCVLLDAQEKEKRAAQQKSREILENQVPAFIKTIQKRPLSEQLNAVGDFFKKQDYRLNKEDRASARILILDALSEGQPALREGYDAMMRIVAEELYLISWDDRYKIWADPITPQHIQQFLSLCSQLEENSTQPIFLLENAYFVFKDHVPLNDFYSKIYTATPHGIWAPIKTHHKDTTLPVAQGLLAASASTPDPKLARVVVNVCMAFDPESINNYLKALRDSRIKNAGESVGTATIEVLEDLRINHQFDWAHNTEIQNEIRSHFIATAYAELIPNPTGANPKQVYVITKPQDFFEYVKALESKFDSTIKDSQTIRDSINWAVIANTIASEQFLSSHPEIALRLFSILLDAIGEPLPSWIEFSGKRLKRVHNSYDLRESLVGKFDGLISVLTQNPNLLIAGSREENAIYHFLDLDAFQSTEAQIDWLQFRLRRHSTFEGLSQYLPRFDEVRANFSGIINEIISTTFYAALEPVDQILDFVENELHPSQAESAWLQAQPFYPKERLSSSENIWDARVIPTRPQLLAQLQEVFGEHFSKLHLGGVSPMEDSRGYHVLALGETTPGEVVSWKITVLRSDSQTSQTTSKWVKSEYVNRVAIEEIDIAA